jgi:O-acetylserine/cysteine efflux transporter
MFFGLLVAAIWGGNFVAAKFGVAHFPPFFLTGLRFCFVTLLLLPFVKPPTRTQLRQISYVAVMLATLHFSLLFAALYLGLDIAGAVITGQLGVPFACLLGAVFFKDRLGIWRSAGMALAFIGIVVVAGAPNIISHPKAFMIALCASLCWGSANVLIKRIEGVGIFQLLAWMGVIALPMLFTLSALFETGQFEALRTTSINAAFALGYTVVLSTLVAYGLWSYLLQRYDVSQVTPYSLLVPVFAVASGRLFFHETISAQVLMGGAITIIGVALIVVRRPKTALLGEAT